MHNLEEAPRFTWERMLARQMEPMIINVEITLRFLTQLHETLLTFLALLSNGFNMLAFDEQGTLIKITNRDCTCAKSKSISRKLRVESYERNVVSKLFSFSVDPGITITKNTVPISKLDVRTIEDILLCGSSKGDFGPTWKFPDGTDVPDKNSPSIWQRNNGSSGYKELHLSPLCTTPPDGQYICQYTANNVRKFKTVSLNFTGTKYDFVGNQDKTTFFGSAGILFLALFAVTLIAFVALLVAHVRLRQISKKSYVINDQRRIHKVSNNIKENTKDIKLTESDAYGAKHQKGTRQI